MPPTFADVLDEALARWQAGESPEEILSHYPQQATALAPLLQMAQRLVPLQATKPPSPGALAAGRKRFLDSAFQRRYTALPARLKELGQVYRGSITILIRAHPLATIVAALILILITVSGGAMAASGGSLPDSPLYPVKLATEQIQIVLTFDPTAQEQLRLHFTERRQFEAQEMERRRQATTVAPPLTPLRTQTPTVAQPASPLATPTPSRTKEPEPTPRPSKTPEPQHTARPSRTPELDTPEPEHTPRPTRTEKPEHTPLLTRTPESERTPTPTRTPEAEHTPEPSRTPEPEHTPMPTRTPEPEHTPGPTRTPEPDDTPESEHS
jgi:hypothetical protein